MKTYLVPTDFSVESASALNYAVEFAKSTPSRIILFHAYHTPLISTESPVELPTLEELEHQVNLELAKLQNRLKSEHGEELVIECVAAIGFAADEIVKFCNKNKVDLILMGTRGAGMLEEKLIGGVTSTVISETKTPVLAVDGKIKIKPIKNIVLATDYKRADPDVYKPMLELAGLYKSYIYVLHIVKGSNVLPNVQEAMDGIKLDNAIEGINHSFHVVENDSVLSGINKFSDKINADLIVMISRKHSFLQRMFNEPNTKQMTFHTTVPLLALHEN